jgi:hypothetical protein
MNTLLSAAALIVFGVSSLTAGTILTMECSTDAGPEHIAYRADGSCFIPREPVYNSAPYGWANTQGRYEVGSDFFYAYLVGEAGPGEDELGRSYGASALSEVFMDYLISTAGPVRSGLMDLWIWGYGDRFEGGAEFRGRIGSHAFSGGDTLGCNRGCGELTVPVTLGEDISVSIYGVAAMNGNPPDSVSSNVTEFMVSYAFRDLSGEFVPHQLIDPAAPTPEPLTMSLIGSGLIGLAVFRRRHHNTHSK